MPRYQVDLKAGDPVPPEIRTLLSPYFKQSEVQRLERLGGRVEVSLVVPYVVKQGARSKTAIDREYITQLESMSVDSGRLRQALDYLTVKQLRDVCKLLNLPFRSRANRPEIVAEIMKSMQARAYWQSISERGIISA